jgi:hypothetical protein
VKADRQLYRSQRSGAVKDATSIAQKPEASWRIRVEAAALRIFTFVLRNAHCGAA